MFGFSGFPIAHDARVENDTMAYHQKRASGMTSLHVPKRARRE
ncbi:hypothetical protein [Methylocystis rosea]|nr:hypothetical protein [Methylocystis rosea]